MCLSTLRSVFIARFRHKDRVEESELPAVASPSKLQQAIVCKLKGHLRKVPVDVAEVLRLKTHWNITLPISRLPPEALAIVFAAYATSVWEEYVVSCDPNFWPYSWITVSHVCRLWRDVALQCPHLWCRIVWLSNECTRALLQRSGQLPLVIDTQCHRYWLWNYHNLPAHDYSPSAEKAIYEHWARIQQAKIDLPHPMLKDLDAPLLTTLDVYFDPSSQLTAQGIEPPGSELQLFRASSTPSLKEISWSCELQWRLLQPLLGPQIEVLRVYEYRTSTVSAEAWVHALREMPNLRVLSLVGAFAGIPSGSRPNLPPLSLPHLMELTMTTQRPYFAEQISPAEVWVLALLHVPASARIELNSYFPLTSGEEVDELSAIVSNNARHRILKTLEMSVADIAITLKNSKSPFPDFYDSEPEPPVDNSISIRFDVSAVRRHSDATRFISGLSLPIVTKLLLNLGSLECSVDISATAFRNMPALRTVLLSVSDLGTLEDSARRMGITRCLGLSGVSCKLAEESPYCFRSDPPPIINSMMVQLGRPDPGPPMPGLRVKAGAEGLAPEVLKTVSD